MVSWDRKTKIMTNKAMSTNANRAYFYGLPITHKVRKITVATQGKCSMVTRPKGLVDKHGKTELESTT